jgi:hypothetical protein
MSFLDRPIKLWSIGSESNPKWVSITPAGLMIVGGALLLSVLLGIPMVFRKWL